MVTTKRKAASAVAAVAVAAAVALGGTFAWQSISQTALNEASDVVNPGGRLHNDFVYDHPEYGTNADVYAENFGEEPIFARVRLEEYLEIVMNQGVEGAEVVDVVAGELRDRESNAEPEVFDIHYFDQTNDTDAYWSWDTDGGSTVYMPTFNKNKDSLEADVNGSFAGSDGLRGEGNRYNDYVDYTLPENALETAIAIYDNDANDVDEYADGTGEANVNWREAEETHEVAGTGYAEGLISMTEWLDMVESAEGGYDPGVHGSYWVYDEDGSGWVYWAQAIQPDTATGLLLDNIEFKGAMDDSWHYAINVVGQFVTAGDVGKTDNTGFYADGQAPSANAEILLETIGVDMSGEAAGFVAKAGTLTGLNMSLYANSEHISVDESTNTLLVNPVGDWQKVSVNLDHETLILGDTTRGISEWSDEEGAFVEHGGSVVDIEYYEDGLDLYLSGDAAGSYKLTASYDDGEGNDFEGSIEFTIEIYDGPGAGESDDGGYEEFDPISIQNSGSGALYYATEDGYVYMTGLDQELGSSFTVTVDRSLDLAENGFTANFEEVINGTSFTVDENDPYTATLTLAPMDSQAVKITAQTVDGEVYMVIAVPIFETIVITPDMNGDTIYLTSGYYTLKAKDFTGDVSFAVDGANRTVITEDEGQKKLSMSSYESASSFTITATNGSDTAIITVIPSDTYPFDGANFSYYIDGAGNPWAYPLMPGRDDYLWLIDESYTYQVGVSLINSFDGTIAWELSGMDAGEAGFVTENGELVTSLAAAEGQTSVDIKLKSTLSVGETLTLTATINPTPDADDGHDENGRYIFTLNPYKEGTLIPSYVEIETEKEADEDDRYSFAAEESATFSFEAFDENDIILNMTNADFTWSVLSDDGEEVGNYAVEQDEASKSVTITHTCTEGACDCPDFCGLYITYDLLHRSYGDICIVSAIAQS